MDFTREFPNLFRVAAKTALVSEVIEFACTGHRSIDQVRRYTGVRYETHVLAVADRVAYESNDVELVSAAVMHDLIEDVPGYTFGRIARRFGAPIASLVLELTDQFTHAAFPQINRSGRKRLERDRLAAVSDGAKLIKLADLIDNARSIKAHEPAFATVFLREVELLIPCLTVPGSSTHARLAGEASSILTEPAPKL